jgi:hypothetical protein
MNRDEAEKITAILTQLPTFAMNVGILVKESRFHEDQHHRASILIRMMKNYFDVYDTQAKWPQGQVDNLIEKIDKYFEMENTK